MTVPVKRLDRIRCSKRAAVTGAFPAAPSPSLCTTSTSPPSSSSSPLPAHSSFAAFHPVSASSVVVSHRRESLYSIHTLQSLAHPLHARHAIAAASRRTPKWSSSPHSALTSVERIRSTTDAGEAPVQRVAAERGLAVAGPSLTLPAGSSTRRPPLLCQRSWGGDPSRPIPCCWLVILG